MAKHKYSGVLGKPDPNGLPRESKDWEVWWLSRIRALFADCGVERGDPHGWMSVALKLADRHVPGFNLGLTARKGAGRNPRNRSDDFAISKEIDALISKGMTLHSAAALVAKKRGEKDGADKFEQRYRRMMKILKFERGGFEKWWKNFGRR